METTCLSDLKVAKETAKALAAKIQQDTVIWDSGTYFHVTSVADLHGWRLVGRYHIKTNMWMRPITAMAVCHENEIT